MSQLIQIRNRMKTINTVKKITHAMRLISMSTHSRLKSNIQDINNIQKETLNLIMRVAKYIDSSCFLASQEESYPTKKIIIIIGSQKGLCGTFNNNVNHYIKCLFIKMKFFCNYCQFHLHD